VVTGGTSMLTEITTIGENTLGLPVRLGVPRGVGGLVDVVRSPMYATGVGLVVYGAKQMAGQLAQSHASHNKPDARTSVGDLGRGIGKWLREIF